MSALRKNVASQVLTFNLVNATTGAALTGATVTTKVALDGTQSAGAGTVTELGTGQYKYVPTQGETNGTSAGFSFTATNAVPVNLHCFTIGQDPTQTTFQADVAKWLGTAAATPNTAGKPLIDVDLWKGSAPNALISGRVASNTNYWNDTAVGTGDAAGYPKVTLFTTVRTAVSTGGAASSITLDASASAVDDFYKNDLIAVTSGTGTGQSRFITAYNGTTKVATVNTPWATVPPSGVTFFITPFDALPGASAPTAAQVATAVWQDLLAGSDFSTASSIGKLLKDDIDAAISSRSTYAGGDTSGTTTLLSRLSAGRATALDFLDAAISSRSTYAGADTAGTTTLLSRIAAAITITSGKVDVNDKTGFALTAGERTSIADALLTRDMSAVTGEAARSPLNALRFLRNKWSIAAGTLTVRKEDDAAVAWTGAVTTSAGDPVSSIDP